MSRYSERDIKNMLDVTNLDMAGKPEAFDEFLRAAREIRPLAICVQPCRVAESAVFLRGSGLEIASVVGFPSGGSCSSTKAFETKNAVRDGASEIDMVINLVSVRRGDFNAVFEDIESVVAAARGRCVKVIVEVPILSSEERELVCEAIVRAKADFVKTCSGFASSRANVEDVAELRRLLPERVRIKASGQVGGLERLTELFEAGARRFGVLLSQAGEILDQLERERNRVDRTV